MAMIDSGARTSSKRDSADHLELCLNHAHREYAKIDRIFLQLQGKSANNMPAPVASTPASLLAVCLQLAYQPYANSFWYRTSYRAC